MRKIYRPCPVCDRMNIRNITRISFNMGGIMPDFYFLAKCNNCGFIFANTPATMQDYHRYYEESNRYSTLPTQSASCFKTYKKVAGIIKKHIDEIHNVLDVGCGSGDILKLMKNDGYKHLTGLDPAQVSMDKLTNAGLSGFKGSIYDDPIKELYGKFDAIILSGVLEHLYDLKTALKNLTLYLKSGGKILCFVPNALEYYLYDFPLPHYFNAEHINHFSPDSLTRLFADNGFSLLECHSTTICFGSSPDPVLLAAFEYTEATKIATKKIETLLSADYLKHSEINEFIESVVASRRKIAIFGAGNFARSLMASTRLKEAKITCFLDNDKSKYDDNFCGYKVNPPSYIKEFNGDVLILSMHSSNQIEKQLNDMGFENILKFH